MAESLHERLSVRGETTVSPRGEVSVTIGQMGELVRLRGQSASPWLGLAARHSLPELLQSLSPALELDVGLCVRDRRPMDRIWWVRDRGRRAMRVQAVFRPMDDGTALLTLREVAGAVDADESESRYAAQERAGLVDRLIGILGQEVPLKKAATACLPPLAEHLGVEAAGFYVVREGTKAEVVAAYGRTRRRGFPYPAVDVTSLGLLLRAGPIELGADDPLPTGMESVTCKSHTQLVISPARHEGEVLAFVVLSRKRAVPLDPADVRLLDTVGALFGLAVRTHALSTQSERSAAVLQTAYAVSRAISRSLDLEMTSRVIAANVARVVPGSRCLLFENDPASGEFVAVASSDAHDPDLIGVRLRLDEAQPPLQGPMQVAVEDLVWGAGINAGLRPKLAARTALLVPMYAQQQPLGLLLIYTAEEGHRYSRAETALAQELAEQAAVAIHNARLYRDLADSQEHIQALLTRLARIRESERQRLASIVHDDILQSVVGTVYQLQAFRSAVPPEVVSRLEDTIGVLRAAIDDARRVISDLRPPVLDSLGFAGSMRALVDRADRDGLAKVGLYQEELSGIGSSQAAALYKITREALTNALRHAGAERVWVDLRASHHDGVSHARLIVKDDGTGADPALVQDPDHFGLTMIHEQAAVAGGWAKVGNGDDGGWVVEAVVPLADRP